MAKKKALKRGPKGLTDEEERVIPITTNVKRKYITRKGGMEKAREIVKQFLEDDNN